MEKGMIGIQMMMLKDKVAERGVFDVMKTCADLGFHCVEISQIPMTAENVEAFQRAGREFSIKMAALSAALEPMIPGMPGEFLTTDFDKIVSDCKTLDCSFLRIGILPLSCMGSREKALDFAKRADEMAERLSEHGIGLYYHNHHIEFVRYDGEYLLDILRKSTKHLGFELDVHWIWRGGEDPVRYIRQYRGRVSLLHLKDYRIGAFDTSVLAGGFDPNTFQQAFTGVVQFAEVGEGSLPMKEIIQAGLDSGSRYFLIEQDDTYGRDPFDCLATSRDNLIRLGYGEWF